MFLMGVLLSLVFAMMLAYYRGTYIDLWGVVAGALAYTLGAHATGNAWAGVAAALARLAERAVLQTVATHDIRYLSPADAPRYRNLSIVLVPADAAEAVAMVEQALEQLESGVSRRVLERLVAEYELTAGFDAVRAQRITAMIVVPQVLDLFWSVIEREALQTEAPEVASQVVTCPHPVPLPGVTAFVGAHGTLIASPRPETTK